MRDSFIFLLFCSNLREKNGHNQGQNICDPIKDLKNILIFYQPNSKTSYVGTPTFTSAWKSMWVRGYAAILATSMTGITPEVNMKNQFCAGYKVYKLGNAS